MAEDIVMYSTETRVEPTIPAVADLFSARARTIIYLLSVMAAAAMGIVSVSTDLHWAVQAVWASWNAFVGLIAVSNVNRPTIHANNPAA